MVLWFAGAAATQAQTIQIYSVTNLGALGMSQVRSLNNLGQVVGGNSSRALLCSGGVITDIGALVTETSIAVAINDSGQVVVRSPSTTDVRSRYAHVFLYQGGAMSDLGTPGDNPLPNAINNNGEIVGSFNGNYGQAAILYRNGAWTNILHPATSYAHAAHGINSSGQIALNVLWGGYLFSGGQQTAVGFTASRQSADVINESGQIVGWTGEWAFDTNHHAFLYSGGVPIDLGTLGGAWSEAYAINNLGQVVGSSTTANGTTHAFIYSGGAMRDINSTPDLGVSRLEWDTTPGALKFVYTNSMISDNANLTAAVAINDQGQILCSGGVLLTPMPPPPTCAQLFWANSAGIKVSETPIFTRTIATDFIGNSAPIQVPASSLQNPPANATQVLLVLNCDNQFPENNTNNNSQILNLTQPDILAASMAWNPGNEALEFSYTVQPGSVGIGSTIAKLFWANGPTIANTISSGAIFTQNIPAGSSGQSPNISVPVSSFSSPPNGATYILLVVDPDNLIPESSENNNTLAIPFTVNTPPRLSPLVDQTIVETGLFAYQVSAIDLDYPYNLLTYSLNSAPPGATIDPATGVIRWQTTEADGPSTNIFSVRVTDNGIPSLSTNANLIVVVEEWNLQPHLDLPSPAYFTADELKPFTNTFTATDPDIPANRLTFSLLFPEPGMVINSANGQFTWTPPEVDGPGSRVVTVMVEDDGNPKLSEFRSFLILINEVNSAPVLIAPTNQVVMELTPLTVPVFAFDTDFPTNKLHYWLSGAPSGMAINPHTGVINWTPAEDQGPSTNLVTVSVEDNIVPVYSDSKSFQVIVNEANVAPKLTLPPSQSIPENVLFTSVALATDADIPTNTLTFSLLAGPSGLAVSPGGVISWKPSEAQGPSVNTVVIQVSDNGSPILTDTKSFTLTVTEVTNAPALTVPAPQTVNELSVLNVTLSATSHNIPAGAMTFSLVSAPSGMTINPGTGVTTWTPSEAQGPDTYLVTARVTEGGNPNQIDTKSFTVQVNEVNRAPVLTLPPSQTIAGGVAYSAQASASDPDNPANSLTYTLISGPAGLVISLDGTILWTPTAAQTPSTNVITVRVADNGTPSLHDVQSYSLIVGDTNSAPVLFVPPSYNINELSTLNIVPVAQDFDSPPNSLSYSLLNAPDGMTINSATGLIVWTPSESQGPGSYAFKVCVADNGTPNLRATNDVTVTVNEVNSAPGLVSPTNFMAFAGAPFNATISVLDPDSPANALTVALVSGPPGLTVSPSGNIAWIPPENPAAATNFVSVKVTDNGIPNLSGFGILTLTTLPWPSISSQPVTRTNVVGTRAAFTVTAAGIGPLAYQWRKDGVNVTNGLNVGGATSASLSLTNVQTDSAGNYDVVVANNHGSVTSLVASLIIRLPSFSSDLLAYYPFNGNANDASGNGRNGIVEGATLTSNRLGQANSAYAVTGSQYIRVEGIDPDDYAQGFSFGGWVRITAPGGSLVYWVEDAGWGSSYILFDGGYQFVHVRSGSGNPASDHEVSGLPLAQNQWQHIFITHGALKDRLYIGGQLQGEWAASPLSGNVSTLRIGWGGNWSAIVDDVAVYGLELTASEVGNVYSALNLTSPESPTITIQPQSKTNLVGAMAAFAVSATGTAPLTYQWYKGGVSLTSNANTAGATSTNLILANVQLSDSGNYTVVVTNSYGGVTSAVAALTVTPPATNQIIFATRTNGVFAFQVAGTQTGVWWVLRSSGLAGPWETIGTITLAGIGAGFFTDTNPPTSQAFYRLIATPPQAPVILQQPLSRTNEVGSVATFVLTASGDSPLAYQWRKNGANLLGATGDSLSLTNVQSAAAGSYDAILANNFGSVTSQVATLTVQTNNLLLGLLAYYPFNGNANDASGNGRHGIIEGATLTSNRLGQADAAYAVTGLQYIRVEGLDPDDYAQGFSFGGWVRVAAPGGSLVYWVEDGGWGSSFILFDGGYQFVHVRSGSGNPASDHEVSGLPLAQNQWQHIFITHGALKDRLYIGGQLQREWAASPLSGNVSTLRIGWGGNWSAIVDDVAVYGRELTASEIEAVYGAAAIVP